jgi:hypothetical protein
MSAISGQKTVAATGTEVALGSQQIDGPLIVKALSSNGGLIYLGNNGAGVVSSTTGFVLAANEAVVFAWVGNLGSIMVDASVNGEGVSWLALDV